MKVINEDISFNHIYSLCFVMLKTLPHKNKYSHMAALMPVVALVFIPKERL